MMESQTPTPSHPWHRQSSFCPKLATAVGTNRGSTLQTLSASHLRQRRTCQLYQQIQLFSAKWASINHTAPSARSGSARYNLRNLDKKRPAAADPDPDPPEPDPAPPIIILNERPAPSSPPHTLTPTPTPTPSHSPATPSPDHPMGSKASKISERVQGGKLQPSTAKQDKEEMKEPSNYYTHRSKSMRRKADKVGGAPAQGSGGGLS